MKLVKLAKSMGTPVQANAYRIRPDECCIGGFIHRAIKELYPGSVMGSYAFPSSHVLAVALQNIGVQNPLRVAEGIIKLNDQGLFEEAWMIAEGRIGRFVKINIIKYHL